MDKVRYNTLVRGTTEVVLRVNKGSERKPKMVEEKALVPWDMFAPGARSLDNLRAFIKQYRFATVEQLEHWRIDDKTGAHEVLNIRKVQYVPN